MQSFFGWVIFVGVFSGKFGEIWAKILRTTKNLPAPAPMSLGISRVNTRGILEFSRISSIQYFVLLYLCWLKATNTDIATGKYLIGRNSNSQTGKTSVSLKMLIMDQQS